MNDTTRPATGKRAAPGVQVGRVLCTSETVLPAASCRAEAIRALSPAAGGPCRASCSWQEELKGAAMAARLGRRWRDGG